MAPLSLASPILWQNEERTVTLLDVPRSIEHAQGEAQDNLGQIRSCQPLQAPYTSTEPKSTKARANVHVSEVSEAISNTYQNVLQLALDGVRANFKGNWCLPRRGTQVESLNQTRKRHQDYDAGVTGLHTDSSTENCAELPRDLLCSLCDPEPQSDSACHIRVQDDHKCKDCSMDGSSVLKSNCSDMASSVYVVRPSSREGMIAEFTFHLPARSSFCLGNVTSSQDFHIAIRNQAQDHDMRRHFDFILLDPPWPNRSVKRTHKTPGTSYWTAATLYDIRQLLMKTDLEILMGEDCLVGIWITNKPAVRNLVLGEGGIFEKWSLRLEEEWVWLKTTVNGEPVTALDGVWRKPYEVLLLGRRHQNFSTGGEVSAKDINHERPGIRVILGVPDLHSRKPCLKTLIEPLLAKRDGHYRALEVFARHLVRGWWSWGDECIKFNWQGFWQRDESKC